MVTVNKEANSAPSGDYLRLHETSELLKRCFFYETNVGAGLPVIGTLQSLLKGGDRVLRLEAILSGSLSFLLGSLELSWSGIRYALSNHEGGLFGFFELAVRKLLYLGFVYWLLEASPALLPMIINSFQLAGGQAAGITALRPSTFLATGIAIAAPVRIKSRRLMSTSQVGTCSELSEPRLRS